MSLYQDLAAQIECQIAQGLLRPGERLPSVRAACRNQSVSPITVTQAYHLLEARGLIEARPRSGYFIRARLDRLGCEPDISQPESASTPLQVSDFIFQILDSVRDPDVTPLGSGFPSPFLFPLAKLGACLASAARHFDPRATLTDLPPGNEALRRQLALRYQARGAVVSPQEIIITSGAMEGLNLCLQAVTKPGDLIAIESPTFYAGLQAAERLGLKVVEIPSHPREGVSLEALAMVLREQPVKACLFMLNFANPTGALVPDERKRQLLALLADYDVPLIEDDVYGELYFSAQVPQLSKVFDPDGRVMHVSSFSKCLAPGYRVGWVAAGRYAQLIRQLKLSTSIATSIPVQIGLAAYLKQGGYDAHLRQLRRRLAAQAAHMLTLVEQYFPASTRLVMPQGGYFLWLELPETVDALVLHQRALAHGISIAPGPIFSARREFAHFIRLNCGHPDDEGQDSAMQVLGSLLADF